MPESHCLVEANGKRGIEIHSTRYMYMYMIDIEAEKKKRLEP